MVATLDNFSDMLDLTPQVLHISCHGIEKKQGMSAYTKGENNFLLLEKKTGEGELVSENTLSTLINKTIGGNLELVFVAACDSEFVGKIF